MPGGFFASSGNFRLEGTVLHAHCQREDGSSNPSSIDLDDCLSNEEGQLIWGPGGRFSSTCDSIRLTGGGAYVTCMATKSDGQRVEASTLLNYGIANKNGELVFDLEY